MNPQSDHLLRSAGWRLRIAAAATRFQWAAITLASIALLAIALARLLAVIPSSWFTPLTLLAVPVLALIIAAVITRRPSTAQVARAIDRSAGTKELFLTASLAKDASGAYGELVQQEAATKAASLKAARLIPFHWQKGTRNVLIAMAALYAAVLWVPQLDPMKLGQKREETAKREQRLVETKLITAERKKELVEKGEVFSQQVDQALAKLDKALKEMKPEQKEVNAKKLNEQAQDFSELWKRANTQIPKEALEKAAQSFGDNEERKQMQEMIEKLKSGDPNALKEAVQKLREKAEQIAKQPDGEAKKEQLDQLAKEMGKLAARMREQLGDKNLNEAMARAMEQLDMAKDKNMAQQALDAANQSMQLSQEEMQRMGEMFKDAKNLEDALKNLQMAKQLNEQGKLDGKDAQGAGANSQQDYEKLYKDLMDKMAQMGEGEGEGEGEGQGNGRNGKGKSGNNPGIGKGGTVGEKDDKTAMKTEKTKSQIGAGKLLMQWKEEGQGDIGQKSAEYENAVRAVKEGVAEAIRTEQVPPGYHNAIQKYFDQLPAKK